MARPRLYEERRVATAIRLPVSLRGQLLEAATERDVSVNLLVTRAISEYLRHLRPLEQPDDRPPRRGNRRPSRTKPT
jgi:hypothetical protein